MFLCGVILKGVKSFTWSKVLGLFILKGRKKIGIVYNSFIRWEGRGGVIKLKRSKLNTSLAAPGVTRSPPATPHRLQHLLAHFIQNGRWGPGIGQTLGYWTLRSTFAK